MRILRCSWPFFFFFLVLIFFFCPSFFKGWLPFPGDLIVGHYAPWNSYSFLGYAPGGVPHKAQGSDVARMLFPWKDFSVEMLKKKQIPLWNPHNFAGNPHLANFQSGIFYPLNFIFLFLPLNPAWTIFIILQPLLASLFTFIYLREIKISRFGSVFASLAFAYCLYFTVWLEYGNLGHAILWLPFALFLVEKIIKKLKIKWFLLLLFSLSSSILAGYIQVTIYLFGVVLLYLFFRLLSTDKQEDKFAKAISVVLAEMVAFLLCSVQLLPSLEIFLNSARKVYLPEKIPELLLPWFYPLTAFIPDFFGNPASRNYWYPGTYIERVTYIGVLPLFFSLLAVFYRRKEKIVAFFIGLVFVALVLTLNPGPARFFYGLKIPIIPTTVPTRILYLLSFSMAALSGFGIDFYLKTKKIRKILKLSFLFFSVYFFAWLFVLVVPKIFPPFWWISYLKITRRNLILPTFFAFSGISLIISSLSFLKKMKKKFFFLGILLLTVFDLFFYFRKITPFSSKEFVFPQTEIMEFLQKEAGINRFWGYGLGYVESNFSTFTRTYSVDGYDPLFISRYGELISASDDGRIEKVIPRADVVFARGFGQENMRANFYRQRLFNLMGVKYVLHKNEGLGEEWQPDYQTFPEEIYQLIWQAAPWQIYENKEALPRTFLAYDYQVIQNDQEIIDFIFASETDLAKTIILEETPQLTIESRPTTQSVGVEDPRPKASGQSNNEIIEEKVEISKYTPNRIEMSVSSSCNSLLFISDNFFPGWQAYLDDQLIKIYRAYYSFRAVAVPAGKHTVVFSYQPQSFKIGLRITLATSLSLIGVIILKVIFKNKKG